MAGCQSLVEPSAGLPLEFRVEHSTSSVPPWLPDAFQVTPGEGVLAFTGEFSGPAPYCQQHLAPLATLEGDLVTFRLEVTRQGSCPDVPYRFAYSGRIRDLAPGVYHFRIEHYGSSDYRFIGEPELFAPYPDALRFEAVVRVKQATRPLERRRTACGPLSNRRPSASPPGATPHLICPAVRTVRPPARLACAGGERPGRAGLIVWSGESRQAAKRQNSSCSCVARYSTAAYLP
jgi:hypothetical protein